MDLHLNPVVAGGGGGGVGVAWSIKTSCRVVMEGRTSIMAMFTTLLSGARGRRHGRRASGKDRSLLMRISWSRGQY